MSSIVDENEISKSKSENQKYEYKLISFQQNLARLKIKNGASGKCWDLLENDRIELENELTSSKSRIEQLEMENRRLEHKCQNESQEKLTQLEILEKQNNQLEQKLAILTKEKTTAKSELGSSKSRIDQLETTECNLQTELQEKQAQLETFQKQNSALIKCKVHEQSRLIEWIFECFQVFHQ